MVVVRPDQYVAKVLGLEDGDEIEKFLEGCLLDQQPIVNGVSK